MKRSIILGIVIGMVAFMSGGYKAHATDVGGQILTDITWDLAGSPYNITADVQVADGITLTVEPGAIVNGRTSGNGDIFLYGGIFNAVGNSNSMITLNDVDVYVPGGMNSFSNIQYANIVSGTPYAALNGRGSLYLTNSNFKLFSADT